MLLVTLLLHLIDAHVRRRAPQHRRVLLDARTARRGATVDARAEYTRPECMRVCATGAWCAGTPTAVRRHVLFSPGYSTLQLRQRVHLLEEPVLRSSALLEVLGFGFGLG